MILLDTPVWVRWLAPAAHPLPARALAAIAAADGLAVSAISCWEVMQLQKRGRIDLRMDAGQWLAQALVGASAGPGRMSGKALSAEHTRPVAVSTKSLAVGPASADF